MLTIFQVITLQGWVDLMYNFQDAMIPAIPSIYFCFLVVLGSFFLLNLILAVIMDSFQQVDKDPPKNTPDKKDENIASPLPSPRRKIKKLEQKPTKTLQQLPSFMNTSVIQTDNNSPEPSRKFSRVSRIKNQKSNNQTFINQIEQIQIALKDVDDYNKHQQQSQLSFNQNSRKHSRKQLQRGISIIEPPQQDYALVHSFTQAVQPQQKQNQTILSQSSETGKKLNKVNSFEQSSELNNNIQSLLLPQAISPNRQSQIASKENSFVKSDEEFNDLNALVVQNIAQFQQRSRQHIENEGNLFQSMNQNLVQSDKSIQKPNILQNSPFNDQDYRSFDPDPQPQPILQNDRKINTILPKLANSNNSGINTPVVQSPLARHRQDIPVLPKISSRTYTQNETTNLESTPSTPQLISPPSQMIIESKHNNNNRQTNLQHLLRLPKNREQGENSQLIVESQSQQSKHREQSENCEIQNWNNQQLPQQYEQSYQQQQQNNNRIVAISPQQTQQAIQEYSSQISQNQEEGSSSRSENTNKESSRQSNSIAQSDPDSQNQIPKWSRRCKFLTCLYHFVNHGAFNFIVILAIFANTIVLALDRYPIPQQEFNALERANLVLYSIFFVEMVLKITGMGFKGYTKDQFNIFDFSIVILSTIQIIVSRAMPNNGVQSGALSAFRGFRLLRVFKIARSWTSFQGLLRKIAETLKDIWSFIILLLIVIFCFAMIGMEFFAYNAFFKYYDMNILTNSTDLNGISPRLNFNNLLNSVILIFVILSGQDWQVVMYDYYRNSGTGAAIFFVLMVIVGNFIFLNLFLAILLKDFEDPENFTKNKKAAQIEDEDQDELQDSQIVQNKKLAQKAKRKTFVQGWMSFKAKITNFFKGKKKSKKSDKLKRSTTKAAKSLISSDVIDETNSSGKKRKHSFGQLSPQNRSQNISQTTSPNQISISQNFTSSPSSPNIKHNKRDSKHAQSNIFQLNRDKYKKQVDVRTSATSTQLALNLQRNRRQSINYNSVAGQSEVSDNKSVDLLIKRNDTNRDIRNDYQFFTSPERQNRLKANNEDAFYGQQNTFRQKKFFQSIPRLKPMQIIKNEMDDGSIQMKQIKLQFNMNNKQQDLLTINELNNYKEEDEQDQDQQKTRKKYAKKLSKGSSDLQDDQKKKQLSVEQRIQGRSLCIFSEKHKMRLFFAKCVSHRVFQGLILFFILASSVILAIENPLDNPQGEKAKILFILDAMMTSIFCLEAALKIVSFGFLFQTKHAYLRSCWNIIDFIIVVFSVVTLAAGTSQTKALKAFRLLRVLRPLRVISRNEGLRLGVQSLLMSIPQILNVFIIALLFFLVFGIFCVNYFKGGFFYCELTESVDIGGGVMEQFTLQSQNFLHLNKQIDTQAQCTQNGGTWLNHDTNFDNTLNATMLLFEMSTTEGWVDVMFWGIQSRGIGLTPKRNNTIAWGIFFIFIFVIGSLFLINLFVGVVIKKFEQMKQILGKNFLLTSAQRQWISMRLMAFKFQPKVRIEKRIKSKCRRGVYIVTSSSWFEWFIMISIFINTALMAITWYNQPQRLKSILQALNYVFAAIFTIQAILKIICMGKIYFHSGWNCFDFIIVCGTLISILIANSTSLNIGTQATLVRAFRIGRIFRLIHRAKSLKMIFDTFIITIPSLANVGAILLLLIYIYAILGVNLFATVKLQDSLNRHANFQSFGVAFLTLMRASTGQAWNSVMHDTARQNSVNFNCINNPSYSQIQNNGINGCGNKFAYFYFISFVIIVSFIYLNLFIAIILQGFSDTSEQANLKINQQTYQDFRQKWSNYDTEGTGLILVKDLPKLLGQLDAPLGIPRQFQNDIQVQRQVLANLRLPSYQNLKYFHFSDVLQALTRQSVLKQKAMEILIQKKEEEKRNNSFSLLEENKAANQLKDIINALEQKNHQSAQAAILKNMIKTQKKVAKKLNKYAPDSMGSQYLWAAWIITQHLQRKVQQRKLKENLTRFINKSRNERKSANVTRDDEDENTQYPFIQGSLAQNIGSISIEQVEFTQMVGGVSFQSSNNVTSAYVNNTNNQNYNSNQKRTIQSLITHTNPTLKSQANQLPAYNQSWNSSKENQQLPIQSRPKTPQGFRFLHHPPQSFIQISHDAMMQLKEVQESSINLSRPQSPQEKEQTKRFKRSFSNTMSPPKRLMIPFNEQLPLSPKFAQQAINYPNMTLMIGTCSTPVSERNFQFTMTDKRSIFTNQKQQRRLNTQSPAPKISNKQFDDQQFYLPQFGESQIRTEEIQKQPSRGFENVAKFTFETPPPILMSEQKLETSFEFHKHQKQQPDSFYQVPNSRYQNHHNDDDDEYSQQEKKAQLQVSFADQFNFTQNDENILDSQQQFTLRQQPKASDQLRNEIDYSIRLNRSIEMRKSIEGSKQLQQDQQDEERGVIGRMLPPLQLFTTISSGISSHNNTKNNALNFEDDQE